MAPSPRMSGSSLIFFPHDMRTERDPSIQPSPIHLFFITCPSKDSTKARTHRFRLCPRHRQPCWIRFTFCGSLHELLTTSYQDNSPTFPHLVARTRLSWRPRWARRATKLPFLWLPALFHYLSSSLSHFRTSFERQNPALGFAVCVDTCTSEATRCFSRFFCIYSKGLSFECHPNTAILSFSISYKPRPHTHSLKFRLCPLVSCSSLYATIPTGGGRPSTPHLRLPLRTLTPLISFSPSLLCRSSCSSISQIQPRVT